MKIKDRLVKLRCISAKDAPSETDVKFVEEALSEENNISFFFQQDPHENWLPLAQRIILNPNTADRIRLLASKYAYQLLTPNAQQLNQYFSPCLDTFDQYELHALIDLVLAEDKLDAAEFMEWFLAFIDNFNNPYELTFTRYVKHLLSNNACSSSSILMVFKKFFQFTLTDGGVQASFQQHDFHQITNGVLRDVISRFPVEISNLLIDSLIEYIKLAYSKFPDEAGTVYIKRVHGKTNSYESIDSGLICSLSAACAFVYSNCDRKEIDALDGRLSAGSEVLARVKRHCYSKAPTKVFEELKNELALYFDNLPNSNHPPEIRDMLAAASEVFSSDDFGNDFLNSAFQKIINGPDKAEYKEWFDEYINSDSFEEAFISRKKYYHLNMLLPFGGLLDDSTKTYLENLKAELEGPKSMEDLKVEDSFGEVHGVEIRSPKTENELLALSDHKLIEYLNTWKPKAREGEDSVRWWIRTNKEGLSATLQDLILHNQNRFSAWGTKVLEIREPIYCRAFLDAGKRSPKTLEDGLLENWLVIAETMLVRVETDSSNDNTDKGLEYVSRGILELIQSIITSTIKASRSQFERVYRVLLALLNIGIKDPSQEAESDFSIDRIFSQSINQTRSRTIETLFQFQEEWRESFGDGAEFLECTANQIATAALDTRIAREAFSNFELSMLGVNSARLAHYNREWTERNWRVIFPPIQENELGWVSSFGSYLLSSRCQGWLYDLLEDEYVTAVENLDSIRKRDGKDEKALTRLGFHLFQLYLWGKIDSLDGSSLVSKYHDSINPTERKDYLGLIVQGLHGKDPLQPELAQRCSEYIDYAVSQFSVKETERLSSCLSANLMSDEWRLSMFKLYLQKQDELGPSDWVSLYTIDSLFDSNHRLTLECLELLTNLLLKGGNNWNFDAEEVGNILKKAVQLNKAELLPLIEEIQENLLKLGRFDYLDLV